MKKTPIEPGEITWKTPGVRGYAALALVVLGLYISLRLLLPAIDAATVSDEVAEADEFDLEAQRTAQASDAEQWAAVIKGRSPFFVPPAPVIEEPVVVEDDEDDGPIEIPKPTRYAGPKIIAAMNGRIWLDNQTVIKLDEEARGVRLVSLDDLPWTVRVEWREVEFDVEIFENTNPRFLADHRDGE